MFDLPQMALFGAFGSIGMLVFVDFGGTTRERFLAYLGLLAGGCLTIALGTLCSHTTWPAVAVMGLVGFAILFAEVIDGYRAAASLGLILTFVIAAMVQADIGELPDRLAGWGVAGLFSLVAIFCLWPGRPPPGPGAGAERGRPRGARRRRPPCARRTPRRRSRPRPDLAPSPERGAFAEMTASRRLVRTHRGDGGLRIISAA